jgi:hypothetical protein
MQSMSFDATDVPRGSSVPSWNADDVLSAHNELERGAPFCSNPSCDLHVRLAHWSSGLLDLQVEGGGGNWVSLPDGRVFGRGRYGNRMLCDACGTRRGPVRLEGRLRLVL